MNTPTLEGHAGHARWEGRERLRLSGAPHIPSGPNTGSGGRFCILLVPPPKLHAHKHAEPCCESPRPAREGPAGSPGLSAATRSEHPSPRQQLANADKFLPFPSAGLGGGLSSWESGVRARPLSFAMQTEKINLPAFSDIWVELQAGSGDKAGAKAWYRYSRELGCLARALVRADNGSPPCVMHNSPALLPSVPVIPLPAFAAARVQELGALLSKQAHACWLRAWGASTRVCPDTQQQRANLSCGAALSAGLPWDKVRGSRRLTEQGYNAVTGCAGTGHPCPAHPGQYPTPIQLNQTSASTPARA